MNDKLKTILLGALKVAGFRLRPASGSGWIPCLRMAARCRSSTDTTGSAQVPASWRTS